MFLIEIDTAYIRDDSQAKLYAAIVNDACEQVGITFLSPGGLPRWGAAKAIATAEQVAKITAADPDLLKVKVLNEVSLPVTASELPAVVDNLMAKLEQLSSVYGNFNGRCEVHMPGNLLLQFNKILLLEDCCSDGLQEALDKGWRIVSAQPQPDQRRPDYILGRYVPDTDLTYNALRRP